MEVVTTQAGRGFPFAPPPPDLAFAGALDEGAALFTAHVEAERRRTWTASSRSLIVRPDGSVGAEHHPFARFEEAGFRRVLVYFNDNFPRATPVLSRLSSRTFATVWRELYEPAPDEVQILERIGRPAGRAVWGASPPSFDHSYDVSHVARDVAGLFNDPIPCLLRYTAADSHLDLVLSFPEYNVRIGATDIYDAGGVGVAVTTKAGKDLGDPLPDVKKRRREGGATIIEGVGAKIRAAPKFYKERKTK